MEDEEEEEEEEESSSEDEQVASRSTGSIAADIVDDLVTDACKNNESDLEAVGDSGLADGLDLSDVHHGFTVEAAVCNVEKVEVVSGEDGYTFLQHAEEETCPPEESHAYAATPLDSRAAVYNGGKLRYTIETVKESVENTRGTLRCEADYSIEGEEGAGEIIDSGTFNFQVFSVFYKY